MNKNSITFGKRQMVTNEPDPAAYIQMRLNPKSKQYLGKERRQTFRRKMLKTCKIVFNNQSSVFDGVMVNLSETGAKLKVKRPAYISNEFLLTTVYGSRQYICSVRWRDEQYIGVEFE